jgi:hypothetical protein
LKLQDGPQTSGTGYIIILSPDVKTLYTSLLPTNLPSKPTLAMGLEKPGMKEYATRPLEAQHVSTLDHPYCDAAPCPAIHIP